jgi:two-component sensor histidine kinase
MLDAIPTYEAAILMSDDEQAERVAKFLDAEDLPDNLEDERFKLFLDQMPIAVAIAKLQPTERIFYANQAFERLSEIPLSNILGKSWDLISGLGSELPFAGGTDDKQAFQIGSNATPINVWSNVIESEGSEPLFRLVAIAALDDPNDLKRAAILQQLQDKDLLLRELQHRVKNNLQMITALIRMEARNLPTESPRFDRLASRIEALALLYSSLSEQGVTEEIDLGVYLSQVASAQMRAQAVEGIRLDLRVDAWPVSINVAMPTGLVVNELMMNALKHAFQGRDGGTITLHSLVDDAGCRVVVADDGVGLPEGTSWPQPGKLSALILRSLRENAKATVEIASELGRGMRVTIRFSRQAAASGL